MFGARALAIGVLAGLLLGSWGGCAWQKGRTALEQARDLKAQQAADRKTIADLRQTAVDTARAWEAASARMGAIAAQLEQDREANRQFEEQQRAQLAQLLAARPDLRGVRVGADLLRHWQQSNAGRAATAATTGAGSQPAQPVPAAADAHRRQPARPARQP